MLYKERISTEQDPRGLSAIEGHFNFDPDRSFHF